MAKISTLTTIQFGGNDIQVQVGTLGKGKGANKVRLIPVTKNPSELLQILQGIPSWNIVVQKLVAGLFSRHSTAAFVGEFPAELTEESLKVAIESDAVSFDNNVFLESVEGEFTSERAGRVNPEEKLAEWMADNHTRYTELVKSLTSVSMNGGSLTADEMQELGKLLAEQDELTAAVAKHEAEKAERAAKRKAAATTK